MSTLPKLKSIFLSYRRDDSAGDTGRIFDHLQNAFGDDQLFFDVNAIDAGNRWSNDIQAAVHSCDVLLAIIGKRWLTVADEYGRRRLDISRDYVRQEISTAIRRQIRIIPVIVGKADLPRREGLPEPLKRLLDYQAIEIRHDKFYQDVQDLIAALEKAGIPRRVSDGTGVATTPHELSQSMLTTDQVDVSLDIITSANSVSSPLQRAGRLNRSAKMSFLDQLLNGKHTGTWQRTLLGDCLEIFRNKPSKSDERLPGQYPYYGVSGVVEYVNYFQYDGEYLLINGAGSNLLDRSAPVVTYVTDRFAASSSVYVARVANNCSGFLMPQYLTHLLATVDFRPLVQGSVQPFLSLQSLRDIQIAIPPLGEQMRVVNLLENHLSNLERARTGLQEQLLLLDELETALYQDALGKGSSD